MLSSNGDTDQVLRYSGCVLLVIGELLVGSGPWVDSQSLRISNICKVRDKLEAVHDLRAGISSTLDTKGQHTTEPALEILQCVLVRWVGLKTWVRDPRNLWLLLQPLRQCQSVLAVTLSAERESLNTLDQLESSEWVKASSHISQHINTNTDCESDWSKGIPELETVETRGWLHHVWEASSVSTPIELAGVDDNSSNSSSVATNPLGSRVDDDVSTVVNWANEVAAGAKGVVDDKWDAMVVCDLRECFNVGNRVSWVTNGLNVESPGLIVDCGSEVFWVISLDKGGCYAETWEEDLKLVVRSSVEVGGGDNVVSCAGTVDPSESSDREAKAKHSHCSDRHEPKKFIH